MQSLVQKMNQIEQRAHEEKGPFALLALFLRKDAPGTWDLVAAADWIDVDRHGASDYLASLLQSELEKEEMKLLARIAFISCNNPGLRNLQKILRVQEVPNGHGVLELFPEWVEIMNIEFSGQEIMRGYLFALHTIGKSSEIPEEGPNKKRAPDQISAPSLFGGNT